MMLRFSLLLLVGIALSTNQCPENCARIEGRRDPPCQNEKRHCSEGCESGFHGETCYLPCDEKCLENSCRQIDGTCTCQTGYIWRNGLCRVVKGVQCQQHQHCRNNMCKYGGREECLDGCKQGWTGKFCKQKCSTNCNCVDVKCSRCIPGWYGTGCESRCTPGCLGRNCDSNGTCEKGCELGLFGDKCQRQCSTNCVSGCDQLSGECVQCEAGRYGSTCQSECSAGCADCDRDGRCRVDCDEGYYGEKCELVCPPQCHDSLCDHSGCHKCTQGFFGTYCNEQCIHCTDGMCHQETGGCFKGCRLGYHGENCETVCPQYCKGDLCDLNGTCITCKTGFYGPLCRMRCEGCLNGDCHKDTGKCNDEDNKETFGINFFWVAGGVMVFIIGAVFMVYVSYRLKRMGGRIHYSARWRRHSSAVGDELGDVSSPRFVPNLSAFDGEWASTPPRVCFISRRRPHTLADPIHSYGFPVLPEQQDSDRQATAASSDKQLHSSDGLLNEAAALPYFSDRTSRPDSYVLPNYCEINEDLILTPLGVQRRQQAARSEQSLSSPLSDETSTLSATGGDINIPLIAECSWNTETEDSSPDKDFRHDDENYDHPFRDHYC